MKRKGLISQGLKHSEIKNKTVQPKGRGILWPTSR
jgi:hypothetical protein